MMMAMQPPIRPNGKDCEIMKGPVAILYISVISRLKWYLPAQSPIQVQKFEM